MAYVLMLILVGCTPPTSAVAPVCDDVKVMHNVYASEEECLKYLRRRGTKDIEFGGHIGCIAIPLGKPV